MTEFVLPGFAMFSCLQSGVLLAPNSKEPGRPVMLTWYVPVDGTMTVIGN